jgi:hypothetical protein
VVDFRDSRIALYTGKNAIIQADTTETDGAGVGLSNPLDLYMQRQPVLRVQVRFDNYPWNQT